MNIITRLEEIGINPQPIIERYSEPHRFYHNWEHIQDMVESAERQNIMTESLLLAIVFHDIIYDPKRSDNEEWSAAEFEMRMANHPDKGKIKMAILETKTHKPNTELGSRLCELDLEILNSDSTYRNHLIEFEHNIFKEYQWVDYKIYKEKRIDVLRGLSFHIANKQFLIDYVANRKINIAVYPGSFNPFHKGHLNILQKAEKIFDKVIIAQGINKEKIIWSQLLPQALDYRQCVRYDGLLTDFLDSLEYETTVIRGLRNSTDLQYELTQYRFLQELKPGIKVVSIFCDKEFEHISSSAIRNLNFYNKGKEYLI